MASTERLATSEIAAIFADEIMGHGGSVIDNYIDEERVFARSALPRTEWLALGDGVKGGVAIRKTRHEIFVNPYLFRLKCRNGSITVQALGTCLLDDVPSRPWDEIAAFLHAAVASSCEEDVFTENVERMRGLMEREADLAISLMPLVAQFGRVQTELLHAILKRTVGGGDRSVYALQNAITSVARDTLDPQERWDLEEFAGRMLLDPLLRPPLFSAASVIQSEARDQTPVRS